jgi:hypothetical protein
MLKENQPKDILDHPSGINDEGELGFVSMEFWMMPENVKNIGINPQVWDRLLSFQQGWKACKDFHKIND